MQSRGVRRPSVCLSVCPSVCKLCANRYFYHRSGWIATKLAHDGPQKSPHPGYAQGQGQGQRSRDADTFLITRKSLLLPQTWLDRDQTCTRWSQYGPASRMCSRSRSRSKVTWYGHFCDFTKIASSHRQMAGSPPNLHTMVPIWACIQGVLKVKVKVKGHARNMDSFVISRKSLILAGKWLDRDHTCTRCSPAEPASRTNLHTIVPRWACIQGVLRVKVKVKGHVIRALLWCHEMFTIQYLLTFSLSMHSLYVAPLRSPSRTSVRQLDVMSTSWNELLRHWRSGFLSASCFILQSWWYQ